jgi:integrase
MVLPMSRPQAHPKTGVYRARKVVPADLRTIVGAAQISETLGTKDPREARRVFPEVMGRIEARLAAARAQRDGQPNRPTPRQIAQLAGVIYRDQVAFAEAEPGTVADREIGLDILRDQMDSASYPPWRLREVRSLLTAHGFSDDAETVRLVAMSVTDARFAAESVGLMRAGLDWSPAPYATRYPSEVPTPTPPPAAASPSPEVLTFEALHAAYSRENPKPEKTRDKRRGAFRHLAKSAGHDDARRIGKPEVRAFKAARQADGVHANTINDALATLRPIWRWAADNEILPAGANPFAGMAVSAPRGPPTRVPYSADDAALVLKAARLERGFLRWAPWLLALTGCRLEEACGALKEDVRKERDVWCLVLHSGRAGRDLKTADAQRMVPLHPALIGEGFLAYVMALPAGAALFPDVPPGSYARRGSNGTRRLGRWVRGLGIKDKRVAPAHSWRHWLKDALRFAEVPLEAADAIFGHVNRTNAGSGYGDGWRGRPDMLAPHIAKVLSPIPPLDVPLP